MTKLHLPARFVDFKHRAITHTIEVSVEDGQIFAAIRILFRGITFELRKVNSDATLVYHQDTRK